RDSPDRGARAGRRPGDRAAAPLPHALAAQVAAGRRAVTFWSRWAWPWITNAHHWHGSAGVPARLIEHLEYSGLALAIALAIALPAGLAIGHWRRGGFAVVSVATAGRAAPTLGLLILAYLLTNAAS